MDNTEKINNMIYQLKSKLGENNSQESVKKRSHELSSIDLRKDYDEQKELSKDGIDLNIPGFAAVRNLLLRGEVCVIGGYYQCYKTLLLLSIIYLNVFRYKKNCLLISLKDSKKSILNRLSLFHDDPKKFISDLDDNKNGKLLIIDDEDFKNVDFYSFIKETVCNFSNSLSDSQIDLLAVDSLYQIKEDIPYYKKSLYKNVKIFIQFITNDLPEILKIKKYSTIFIHQITEKQQKALDKKIRESKWHIFQMEKHKDEVIAQIEERFNRYCKSLDNYEMLAKGLLERIKKLEAHATRKSCYDFEPEVKIRKNELIEELRKDFNIEIEEVKKERINSPYGVYSLADLADPQELIDNADVCISLWHDVYCKKKNIILMQLLYNKDGATIGEPIRVDNDLKKLLNPAKNSDLINELINRSIKEEENL